MKKLRKYLETWLNGGKVRGLNVSLLDITELYDIYCHLTTGEKPTTIIQNVNNILNDCGIKTKSDGIGWKCV